MAIRTTISIMVIFFLYGCETVVKEYDIHKLNYAKDSYIKDSITLNLLYMNNKTISGWEEDKKTPAILVTTGLEYTQNDLNNCIYKFEHRKFYIFDTIDINENHGVIILRREEIHHRQSLNDELMKIPYIPNYDETLFLSLFNKNNKPLKTYIIAKDVDTSAGEIGGGEHIKSELTNKDILITHRLVYGFLDIGNPPFIMDSIITKYNLRTGVTICIDTIKSIKEKKRIF